MANLVAGWTEADRSYLVERRGDETFLRTVPARWALFATRLDDSDRADLARDPRVTLVKSEGDYTRIQCRNRWARRDIIDVLQRAGSRRGVEILEGDVSPIVRLLADVPSLEIDPEPRLGFFDLETDSRASFIAMKAGEARILSWALCGEDGVAVSGLLEADSDEAERALIRDFVAALARFDVLLAWNGDGFDFPVIQCRAQALGLEIQWHRWCWLDHLEVFKKYNMHSDGGGEEKASFKLDHVATYLLGEGKHDFDASKTWEAWAAGGDERQRLLRYNEQDTALLPRIEAKTGFLGLHLAVCHICRVFPDTHSLHATAQGDGFLLRLGADHGYRWATRPEFGDEPPAPFKGAFVMEPQKLGAIDNVHVCDFAGLYPSIMRTWNMSPDTKVDDAQLLERSLETTEPTLDPGICQLPRRRTWFRTDTDGMFRIALDTLVAKRAEYQAEMKRHTPGTPPHSRAKRLQGAFKIVANSFYGITGSPYSRFFDPEIAEGVTQTGRWLLESVIAEARSRDLDPFYGDTDSVFIAGAAEAMRELVSAMNASWAARLEPWGIGAAAPMHIDLDFEKTFHRILIVSAKRYAGAYQMYKGKTAADDAKPEVKGLEFKRGDTIRLARAMQEEIVTLLLRPGPIAPPSEARAILERYRAHVLEGRLELADVRITQSLSKKVSEYALRFKADRCPCGYAFGEDRVPICPACNLERPAATQPLHVRVAKMIEARGEPLGEGDRVAYVVTGSKNTLEALPATDPGIMEKVDRSYYWERRIYPATSRILEHVYPGVHWGESKVERRQRVLEQNGQRRIDFTPIPGSPRIRRRKRQKKAPEIVFTVVEKPRDDEALRRLFAALRAAIEAHPGDAAVTVAVRLGSEGTRAEVTIPTKMGIAQTREARIALERLAGKSDLVTGFAV